MAPQITLIGLGRIGTSIGLALKRRASGQLQLIGHDRDLQITKQAQAKGAVDRAEWNLPAAVENADAVLLCVPLSSLRDAMKEVSPFVKAGCVISDTAPLKAPVLEWAAELFAEGHPFVGGHPILNPAYLHDDLSGAESARADLFDRGLWALTPTASTPPHAVKLIDDLVRLTGATPFFVGAAEHDGLLAVTGALPALSATALIRVASKSAGWADARKLADRSFASAAAPLSFASPAALRAAAVLNKSNVLHYLDALIDQLAALRKSVADEDSQTIEALLVEAAAAREVWLSKRREADWDAEGRANVELPTTGQILGQMIGLRGKKKS